MNRLNALPMFERMRKNRWVVLLLLALVWIRQPVAIAQEVSTAASDFELLSVPPPGASGYFGADNDEGRVSAGQDGRFVLFSGVTENWWPPDDEKNLSKSAVWLRDRRTLQTHLVTQSPSGELTDGACWAPALSADGRVVVMQSNAFNLISPPEYMAGGVWTSEWRSRVWERIDVLLDGTGADKCSGNGMPALSADGRYVAFASNCNDIVAGDDDDGMDVFLRDRQEQKTIRVSLSSEGQPATTPGTLSNYAISGDGKVIAFSSDAGGLVPDVEAGVFRIYVRDLSGTVPTTKLVSKKNRDDSPVYGIRPAISPDGRYIAYSSPVVGIQSSDKYPDWDVFVYDRLADYTYWASMPPDLPLTSQPTGDSHLPWGAFDSGSSVFSDDGRYLVFLSNSSKLVPSGADGKMQVIRRDLHKGSSEIITKVGTNAFANEDCNGASISGLGDWVYFWSRATNISTEDTNDGADVFGLLAARTIKGRVTLGDTAPLSGASILVKGLDGGGTEYWAFTNAEGIYQVSGLTLGNYSITPFKAGHDFQPKQRKVTLGDSKDSQWFKGRAASGDGVTRYRALLIGISPYEDMSDLVYADKDAFDIRTMLLTGENWDARFITALTNRAATANGIKEQMIKLGEAADGDDVVLISFSGHGTRIADKAPMDEADLEDEALAPYDNGSQDPLSDDEFSHLVNRLGTANYMIFLDCCYSGGEIWNASANKSGKRIRGRCKDRKTVNAEREGTLLRSRPSVQPLQDLNDLGSGAVLTSVTADQLSAEDEKLKNGIFSHFAIEGMRKRSADYDDDGWITASELFDYAAPRTSGWAWTKVHILQDPQYYYGSDAANLAILGPYRTPDLLIAIGGGRPVGNDVFSAKAEGQEKRIRLGQGEKTSFRITLQNQSSHRESYRLTVTAAVDPKATLKFLHEGKDISSSLRSKGGWVTPKMEPGEELIVTARVRVASKLPRRYAGACGFRLTAQLRTLESHEDAVEGWVPIVGPKKASMVLSNYDPQKAKPHREASRKREPQSVRSYLPVHATHLPL